MSNAKLRQELERVTTERNFATAELERERKFNDVLLNILFEKQSKISELENEITSIAEDTRPF